MVSPVTIFRSQQLELTRQRVEELLKEIPDPEIPVISIYDLGILRKVEIMDRDGNEPHLVITISPTYSGCPAMDMIQMQIRLKLLEHGYKSFQIQNELSPPWTTDWISAEGKQKLKAFGIAPPNPAQSVCDVKLFQAEEAIQCPRCNSYHTRMVSEFGSTPCKSQYACNDCLEPFDYFKCH